MIDAQYKMGILADNCCLAISYYWLMMKRNNREPSFGDFVEWLGRNITNRSISEEGYVLDAEKATGMKVVHSKTNNTNEPQIACFCTDKATHFVVALSDGTVIFDPIINSRTVANGTIKSWRIMG